MFLFSLAGSPQDESPQAGSLQEQPEAARVDQVAKDPKSEGSMEVDPELSENAWRFYADATFWLIVVVAGFLFLSYRKSKRRDIAARGLPDNLPWNTESERTASIHEIFRFVTEFSTNSIQWYCQRRQNKKQIGSMLRIAAMCLTTVAGLIPVLMDLMPNAWYLAKPEFSTVFLALAALLLSLDHFGGFTSGWVRYMLAQQEIERLQHQFEMNWQSWKAKCESGGAGEICSGLEKAREFLNQVDKVIEEETQQWAKEFRSALQKIEETHKTATEALELGAVNVSLKNHVMGEQWALEVDGVPKGRFRGSQASVGRLVPGIYNLSITLIRGDEEIPYSQSVKLVAGQILTVEFDLA